MKTKTAAKQRKPIREVLAENLKKRMAATVHLDTQMKLQEASGVGQTSIGRILSAQGSSTLDVMERLADAFNIDVADLLVRPDSRPIAYDRRGYDSLPDYKRGMIESQIAYVIDQHKAEISPRPRATR